MGSITRCSASPKTLTNFRFDRLSAENIWFVTVNNSFGYEGFVFDHGDPDKNIDCINNIAVSLPWWVWPTKASRSKSYGLGRLFGVTVNRTVVFMLIQCVWTLIIIFLYDLYLSLFLGDSVKHSAVCKTELTSSAINGPRVRVFILSEMPTHSAKHPTSNHCLLSPGEAWKLQQLPSGLVTFQHLIAPSVTRVHKDTGRTASWISPAMLLHAARLPWQRFRQRF